MIKWEPRLLKVTWRHYVGYAHLYALRFRCEHITTTSDWRCFVHVTRPKVLGVLPAFWVSDRTKGTKVLNFAGIILSSRPSRVRGISQKKGNAFCRKRKKSLTVCSMDSVSEALLASGLPLYCCWDLWRVGSPPPVPANKRSTAHPTSCALNQLRSRPLFHNILLPPL